MKKSMMQTYEESDAVQVGLYNMTVDVFITPIGIVEKEELVELRIGNELIGHFPTYTQACEEVLRIVNQY